MQKQSSKVKYVKPQMVCFGKVSQLTAGGTGSLTENAMMTALMKKP